MCRSVPNCIKSKIARSNRFSWISHVQGPVVQKTFYIIYTCNITLLYFMSRNYWNRVERFQNFVPGPLRKFRIAHFRSVKFNSNHIKLCSIFLNVSVETIYLIGIVKLLLYSTKLSLTRRKWKFVNSENYKKCYTSKCA